MDPRSGFTVGGILDNDVVGATNGSKDVRPRAFCEDDFATLARNLGLWLDEFLGRDAVRLVFHRDRFGWGGDHLPFLEAGAVTLEGVRIDDQLFAVRSIGTSGERPIAIEVKPQVRRPAGAPPAK